MISNPPEHDISPDFSLSCHTGEFSKKRGFEIVGTGDITNEKCGEVRFVTVCRHNPHEEGHHKTFHKEHCDNWLCPICYDMTAYIKAKKLNSKLQSGVLWAKNGIIEAFKQGSFSDWAIKKGFSSMRLNQIDVHHIEFNLPLTWIGDCLRTGKNPSPAEARQLFLSQIVNKYTRGFGGIVIVHLYRIREEYKREYKDLRKRGLIDVPLWDWIRFQGSDWENALIWGPHIHFIGLGRVEKSSTIYKKTGWTYKTLNNGKRLNEEESFRAIKYALNHATVELSDSETYRCRDGEERKRGVKCAYSWVGILSNQSVKYQFTSHEREYLRCEKCKSIVASVRYDDFKAELGTFEEYDPAYKHMVFYHWTFKHSLARNSREFLCYCYNVPLNEIEIEKKEGCDYG